MASLWAILLAAPAARAGTYVWKGTDPSTGKATQSPTISGTGAEAVTSPSFTGNRTYTPAIAYLGYMNGGCALDSAATSGTASDSLSGTIVATFTWQPDPKLPSDPAPTCVIVSQSCGINCAITGTGSGSISNGLGASASGPSTSGCSSLQYVVKGGATFSVSCSPTMSASVSASASGAGGSIYVHIGYKATAYLITVIPNGAQQDSTTKAYSLLTGQQVSTGLTGVPFTPGTGSTYAWSAGGDTFYTYNEKAPSHQLVLLSDAPSYTTSPGFSFYDKSAESVTITCNAALVCPDGSSVTVNPSSQPINVLKPTASWKAYTSGPFVNNSGGYGANEVWNPVTITVPAPFTSTGGLGCFAQLITPSRQVTRSLPAGMPMVYATTYYDKVPDGKGGWTLPSQGLDTALPYQAGYVANPDGSPGMPVNGSSYTWNANGGTGISGDRPTAVYNPPAVSGDPGGTNWYTATMTDSFTTWLMYQPPGGVWVPLQKLTWSTNITVSNTSGSWTVSSGSTVTTPSSGTNASDSPNWSSVNNVSSTQMSP